jgi:DNA repair photolyase
MATRIKIQDIIAPEDVCPRVKLSESAIEDYARAMKDGLELPPIVVFQDKGGYHLADGWHRLEAARRIGEKLITADIRKGSRRDALLYAVGANAKHGLRRTRADKRRSVQLLLDDPEWRKWSVNRIAEACNVSWDLVEDVRGHLPDPEDGERRVKRGNSIYTQKVGKRRKKSPKPPETPLRLAGEMLGLIDKARLLAVESGRQQELANKLPEVAERLQRLIGKQTGARRLTDGLVLPLNVYKLPRKGGIDRTKEFEKKGLATYAVNVGLGCGHGCYYCSSPSLRRTHPEFLRLEQTAFTTGIAIVDPKTPERLRENIPALTEGDVVQICTLDDAWSPEARRHNLGRRCLEIVLQETPAQVRVLTKSHLVEQEFDLLRKHCERVIVGLSTGTPVSRENIARIIEPNASSISERLAVLRRARTLGLRTFGMLCPVLPGVGDSRQSLEELFDAVLRCRPEAIWLEPVNPRGPGLPKTSAALRLAGHRDEAAAVDHVRKKADWSSYATALIRTAIEVADSRDVLNKFKVLLYPEHLSDEHRAVLKQYEQGIVWLGKEQDAQADAKKAEAD